MNKCPVYSFLGNCEELSEPIKLEKCECASEGQARENARYWLCNYKEHVLTSVDIYIYNEYIGRVE